MRTMSRVTDVNDLGGSAFIKVEKVAIPMDLQCCVNGYESKDSF